jgi:glycosyltransferase involved in cell wall biosynthesis
VARIPVADALRRLIAEHEDVRVEGIGVDMKLAERYRHDRLVAFRELPRRMGGWDIGIAPLADLPMNRTRSDIKLKEYAASGVVWLASPIGPYVGLGEEQGGRLVPDDGWFEALERLVAHRRERRRLARKARAWAKRQTVDVVADRWERVFTDAAAIAGARR